MVTLEIISALLLLLNKIFVRKKKTIGWTFGIWGTIFVSLFFYLQMVWEHKGNLWIMVVYDIALFLLMVYGYMVASSVNNPKRKDFLKKWNLEFKLSVCFLTAGVCVFLLIKAITADMIFIQFLGTLCGLVGTLLLAFDKGLTNKIGWLCYVSMNLLVAYLMFKNNSYFFMTCQVISAIISFFGLTDELSKTSKKQTDSNP